MFEALGAGCPVVITDDLDLAHVVGAEDVGMVTCANAGALADAVGKILSNDSLRSRMSGKAQRLVSERFSWPAIIPALDQAYADVIDRARRAGANGSVHLRH